MPSSIPMRRSCLLILVISALACNNTYTPRPKGYFRIDFPEKSYQMFQQPGFPYSFEYPVYASISRDSTLLEDNPDNPFWINVDFPSFRGKVYLSYKSIGGTSVYKIKTANGYRDSLTRNSFEALRDEAYKMTFKHTLRASGIVDSLFVSAKGIAGVYFRVEGDAATSRQFYLSDSQKHFIRGALYFDTAPNSDSLSVVNDFLEADMQHLINTFIWK